MFYLKYALHPDQTWEQKARDVVTDVTAGILPKDEQDQLYEYIRDLKLIPGGRYLYYAGRPHRFWNNCFLMRAEEDSRQDWARISCRPRAPS